MSAAAHTRSWEESRAHQTTPSASSPHTKSWLVASERSGVARSPESEPCAEKRAS
ncbi:MAG: hypothetical protein ABW352_25795 [Polyangiales bacterium]